MFGALTENRRHPDGKLVPVRSSGLTSPTALAVRKPARRCVFAGLAIILFAPLAAPDNAPAQSAPAQTLPAQIAAAARQSADQLDPGRIADVEASEREFLDANEYLRAHLQRTTSEANAQAWVQYLELDEVLTAIELEARESEIAEKSTRLSHKAIGVHPGLEVPAVTRLRAAAINYANALRFRRKENTTRALAIQLGRFADAWSEMDQTPSPDEIATLRLLLDLLERTDQNVALVEQSKQQFSSSNLHVTIDESLVERGVNRAVNQCTSVRDCILGTRIVGSALLTGNVTASLQPSIGSIRLQIALSGNVHSDNRGYNGPVRLRTSGDGQVYATRLMQIAESGISLEPVVTTGSLSTRINAIEHPWKLVRRIARKKAAQQKPQADRIAHRKFITRVTDAFTEETDGAVSQPMPDLMAEARPYLQRLDFPEPARDIGSTSDSIYFFATLRKGNQLAAPTTPPPIAQSNQATIQIHESAIDNTIGSILAGRTMSRTELRNLAEKTKESDQAQATSADNDADEEEDEEFEIDFDRSRPVIFEAREGQLRVGIRGTRFAQGSRELKRPLEIVAVYQPVKSESGEIVLDRVGEVQINFPGTKRLSVGQAGMRGAIKQGFADTFPQNLMDKPWIIPNDAKAEAFRGLNFRPRYFDAQDGWLTLGVGV